MTTVWMKLILVQMLSNCLIFAQNVPFDCSPVNQPVSSSVLIDVNHTHWCWDLTKGFKCHTPKKTLFKLNKTRFKCCDGFQLVVEGKNRKCKCEKCPGNLQCDSQSAKCICPDEWEGKDCSEPVSVEEHGGSGREITLEQTIFTTVEPVTESPGESVDRSLQNKGCSSTDNTSCTGPQFEVPRAEGYYGANFSLPFPNLNENNETSTSERNSTSCDPKTGKHECPDGYIGTFCNETCLEGWYGKNCESACQCENNSTCSHISGCQCAVGWSGKFCENNETENNSNDTASSTEDTGTITVESDQYMELLGKYIWYLIIISILLLIFAIISIYVIIYKKRKTRERKKREQIIKNNIVDEFVGDIPGEHTYETIDAYEQGDTYDHLQYFKPQQPLHAQYKFRGNYYF